MADRIDALRKATAAMNLPAAYTTTIAGRGRELERTFVEFIWAFLLSIIFMYMILASQFESLVHPVTILLSLPLAVPFGFLSLWFFNDTLNLYSALGILVLFGVVKKNSILQIDHMNNLRAKGIDRYEAIGARSFAARAGASFRELGGRRGSRAHPEILQHEDRDGESGRGQWLVHPSRKR
jgi:HAE1 family hydrophobic/amphiphilic exporter-1